MTLSKDQQFIKYDTQLGAEAGKAVNFQELVSYSEMLHDLCVFLHPVIDGWIISPQQKLWNTKNLWGSMRVDILMYCGGY